MQTFVSLHLVERLSQHVIEVDGTETHQTSHFANPGADLHLCNARLKMTQRDQSRLAIARIHLIMFFVGTRGTVVQFLLYCFSVEN